jgi:hypothetical protein
VPEPNSTITMKSFHEDSLENNLKIENISLLNNDKPIQWDLHTGGLEVKIPNELHADMATTFKIIMQ